MKFIRLFIILIICVFFLLAACSSTEIPAAADPTLPAPSETPTTEKTDLPTTEPTFTPTSQPSNTPNPTPTNVPTDTPTPESFPFTWNGSWNVWISAPNASIVNTAVFEISGSSVTASWYEGTRQVNLEGILSSDGGSITGTFWNTDIDALDVTLILDPSGAFFTGIADSPSGMGQFCGTRTSLSRPRPCRAQIP